MTPQVVTVRWEDVFTDVLAEAPRPFPSVTAVADAVRKLINAGLADLPLPGIGQTMQRWRALSAAAALDLSLAKLYEGHTDAIAIAAELGAAKPVGLSAVWAAEPPSARVGLRMNSGCGTLTGRKAWCSGAAVVDSAVVSAWTENAEPVLAHVVLRQPGVTVQTGEWRAVGMAASESVSVVFDHAEAQMIGKSGDYVARPGFWQGGAGIAAVWFGATVAVGRVLASSAKVASDPHGAAHLGAVDTTLRAARALLNETAAWIDAHPQADAAAAALRVRACVEAAANEVLTRVGRALGPGLLCGDAIHAQRCADLPVFLRQSHAEHDLAALGRLAAGNLSAWNL